MTVLDALLEGFDEGRHPRGYHGRWIRAGAVLDVFHGNDRIGSVAKTKEPPFPEFTPSVPGGHTLRTRASMDYGVAGLISHHQGTRDAFPFAEHVSAAKDVLKRAEAPGRHPTPTAGLPPDAAGLMRARERFSHVRGVADAAAKAQATRAEILAKSPSAQRELDRYRSVQQGSRRAARAQQAAYARERRVEREREAGISPAPAPAESGEREARLQRALAQGEREAAARRAARAAGTVKVWQDPRSRKWFYIGPDGKPQGPHATKAKASVAGQRARLRESAPGVLGALLEGA